ncbi:hypothetical protein ASF30_11885 [Leifsonia sp. Leaf264]|nr:hypothetical protein ASF30_11885 [Leifsonia sp. Leaf264]
MPIFGEKLLGDMDAIREAKAGLDLPYMVRPMDAAATPKNLRVLALRARPTHLCANVLVTDPADVDQVMAALEWVLGRTNHHPEALTADEMVLPMLRNVFGDQVNEITELPPKPVKVKPQPAAPPKPEDELWYDPTKWMTGADFFSNA